MSGKRCCTCGEAKGVEAFSRSKATKDGLQARCKACKRRHYEENREAVLEGQRRHYEENREAVLDRVRRYREDNREAIAESGRRYREENREAILERDRRYREENREAELDRHRRYREKRRDMAREAATRTGEPYTPAEDAHILTSEEPAAAIAVELGRTWDSVSQRRRRLRKAVSA